MDIDIQKSRCDFVDTTRRSLFQEISDHNFANLLINFCNSKNTLNESEIQTGQAGLFIVLL